MMTLTFTFWLLVLLFAVIGTMRGWAKELLVTFGLVLALFVIAVMERFLPADMRRFVLANGPAQFWIKSIIVILLVFFAYQTPSLPKFAAGRFARERLADSLLGLFLGGINGYMIVGTLWFFMHQAGYPFQPHIVPPTSDLVILRYLPPQLLLQGGSPYIYFAVAIAFLFVLVVFI